MFIKSIIDWILPNRKYNDLLTVSRFVVYFLSRRGKTNNRTGSFMPEPNIFTNNTNVKNPGVFYWRTYRTPPRDNPGDLYIDKLFLAASI